MNKYIIFISFCYMTILIAPPPALKNYGNTCYLNAALQSLYAIQPLTNFIVKHSNIYTSRFPQAYVNLIKEFALNKNPKKIFNQQDVVFNDFVVRGMDVMGSCGQQDASEFMTQLINQLFTKASGQIKDPNNSFLQELERILSFKLISKITCSSYRIEKEEKAKYLSLPMKIFKSLEDYLTEYFKKEIDITYEGERNCTKQYILQNYPTILILAINRYDLTLYNHKIIIPFNNLDISQYVEFSNRKQNVMYDLVAAIEQSGTLTGGHYKAYVKDNSTNAWYLCNDAVITKKTTAEVKEAIKLAYIFVYQQHGDYGTAQTEEEILQSPLSIRPLPVVPVQKNNNLTQSLNNLTYNLQRLEKALTKK